MSLSNGTNNIIARSLYPPWPIQSSILVFFIIISIPCFIFLFYHFLTDRALYSARQNHVVILLLIFSAILTLVDIPVFLAYYYTGSIWPPTVQFCLFRYFLDYYLFTTCYLLLTWGSIERHILIFHINFYNTPIKRLIGHYIPLGFCFIYPFIYYVIFMLFYPCHNYYNTITNNCNLPCYLTASHFMGLYEEIVHGIALMFIILFFNLTLIIRVVRQKQRMRRQLMWAKNFKMAAQLLGICLAFYITNMGYFIIQLTRLIGNPSFGKYASPWVFPLAFCMPALILFMSLNSLPNLKQKIKRLIPCWRNAAVVPLNQVRVQNN